MPEAIPNFLSRFLLVSDEEIKFEKKYFPFIKIKYATISSSAPSIKYIER